MEAIYVGNVTHHAIGLPVSGFDTLRACHCWKLAHCHVSGEGLFRIKKPLIRIGPRAYPLVSFSRTSYCFGLGRIVLVTGNQYLGLYGS